MKRLLPLLLAGFIFILAMTLLRPEPDLPVVVAARDLPAGHALQTADLEVRRFPQSLAPSGAYQDPNIAIGQTLSVDRQAGDVLYPQNMGGEQLQLAPDERAIAVEVSDSAGLAGLLKPGDRVGVTAVIFGSGGQGAFSKAISAGLRVLYLSPEFKARDPLAGVPASDEGSSSFSRQSAGRRETRGTVVLAVPVTAQLVAYDFAAFGVESASRQVNIVDLLPALDHAQNVELSLFLEPGQARRFLTAGVYLPDLVITPGPSPTPTETPIGGTATPPVPVTPIPATPAP